MAIKENFLIEKRNALNEIRRNSMPLQELRFFSIYLAKINARDVNSRKVSFPLKDFIKIMDIDKVNLWRIKQVTDNLLCKIVHLDTQKGGYQSFQLFKECNLYQDELQQWQIEIDAHDKALPLMFEFKKDYFTYELWNALRLKSTNQLRMYELLKQYEKIGERIMPLLALKEFLGLEPTQYPRWTNFATRILDSCQQALLENTDICFTYEPIKVSRKFTGVKFFITKNKNHVDQLSLSEYINLKNLDSEDEDFIDDHIEFLRSACCLSGSREPEFSRAEMQQIFEILVVIPEWKFPANVPTGAVEFRRYHYLAYQYANLNRQDRKNKIKNRFAYLMKILKTEAEIIKNINQNEENS